MNFGGVVHLNKRGLLVILVLFLVIILYAAKINHSGDKSVNLHQLLEVAIKSAENGGLQVVATKDNQQGKSKGLTKEGLIDDVTMADYLSHCSMVSTIQHYFPHIKLISEESTKCDNKQIVDLQLNGSIAKDLPNWEYVNGKDITIWIDPLDATHEYTEKLYQYVTTMVCVAIKGEPIIGVIHKPFEKTTSWSWLGKGKSPDLITEEHNRDYQKIIISRSHSGNIKKVLDGSLKDKKFELVIAAGAGYKVLEVAKGNVDAYLHITAIKKWDICAGNAILNAVNGQMTTKTNQKIDYTDETNVVNTNGLIATVHNHETYLNIG